MVTMRDVAARAGVSMKTVSNVINDFPFVTAATRARVEEALVALDYHPNLAARHLASGRSGVIALVVPFVDNPYFAELVRHIVDTAKGLGYTVAIEQTAGRLEAERDTVSGWASRFTDGMILSPQALTTKDLNGAVGTGKPLVLLGERVEAMPGAHHVGIDNVRAAREAVRHLLDLGRTRIAVIGDQQATVGDGPSVPRLQGAREALVTAGRSFGRGHVRPVAEYSPEDGERAMRDLLRLARPPDAVFCFTDLLAIGALFALHEAGVRVPQDVAVMGFDDVDASRFTVPPLTSVSPDKRAIARHAVRLAVGGSGAVPGGGDVVGHRLVVRRSTGGAAR